MALGAVGGAALLAALLVGPVPAQDRSGSGTFLPSGGELEVLWQRLDKAVSAGDWDSTVEGLTRYAEMALGTDSNIVISSGGGLAPGVRSLFRKLVARLDPAALERYRGRLDAFLQAAWRESSLLGGEEHRVLRHRIVRDFPEAALLSTALEEEADQAFLEGRFREARAACEALLRRIGAGGVPEKSAAPEALRARWLLLEVCRAMGDASGAATHASFLREQIQAEGGAALAAELRAKLERAAREQALEPGARPGQGADLGGRPAAPYRLGGRIWGEPDGEDRISRFVAERARTAPTGNVPLPFHPAGVSGPTAPVETGGGHRRGAGTGWFFFQHPGRLLALDASTMVKLWSCKLGDETDEGFVEPRVPLVGGDACYVNAAGQLIAVDRWRGDILWKRRFRYDRQAKALRIAEGTEAAPAGETASPRISLSPAAFLDDDIVVATTAHVDREHIVYLSRLGASGREVWTTLLGSSQQGDHLGLGGVSAIPVVHDGMIYEETGAGFVAAVDGTDGCIAWLSEYPRLSSRGLREAIRREDRWHPGTPPVVVGSTAIVAPHDSALLLALEVETGEILWSASREDGAVVAGADGEACFVVGATIRAIAHSGPKRGKTIWERAFLAEDQGAFPLVGEPRVLGAPVLRHSEIVVPTRDSLLCLSTKDGSTVSRVFWEFGTGGGNIVLVGELLAVTNPSGFSVYDHEDADRARVERLPPRQPASLLEKAKFHLRRADLEAGLSALAEWRGQSPPPPEPNSPADALQLDTAETLARLAERQGDAGRAGDLLRYRILLERIPRRRVEASIALGSWLQRTGDLTGALRTFHDALTFDQPETEFSPHPLLVVKSGQFLRDRIRSLRGLPPASGIDSRAIDAAAEAAFGEARRQDNPTAYLQVLQRYPYSTASGRAYLALADCYHRLHNEEQVIQALEGYARDFPAGPQIVRAKLQLFELLEQTGQYRQASELGRDLIEKHGSSRAEGWNVGQGTDTVAGYLSRVYGDLGAKVALEGGGPGLRFPVRMAWRSPAELQALSRLFLVPAADPPEALRGCFLTQSTEVLECRRADSGLPLWRIDLEMIPGFEFDDSRLGFRFPRNDRTMFRGRFVGPLLVLHDNRNLLAVDSARGVVKWHRPFGSDTTGAKPGGDLLRHLREQLRAVAITDGAVFAASTGRIGGERREIRRFDMEGEVVWSKEIDYEPAVVPPSVLGNTVFVHALRPPGIHFHDAATGDALGFLGADQGFEAPVAEPVQLPGGKLLLPFSGALKLLDLETRKIVWSFSESRAILKTVAWFPSIPGECLVVINRKNNWPAVLCVSLDEGKELWRFEDFPARNSTFSLFREAARVYVIHGDDQWKLVGLQVRSGPDGWLAEPTWPAEITLGNFGMGIGQRRLHIGEDSLIFAEPTGSLSVFDKELGVSRNAQASVVSRFLVEKGNFTSDILDGRLVLLTDGGDAAFETTPRAALLGPDTGMDLVRAFLERPGDSRVAARLALHYFVAGELDVAIRLLDHALLSEEILEEAQSDDRFLLRYMLDGMKEERMKDDVPQVASRRMARPPAIDGSLEDAWEVGTRIRLESPVNVGSIPGPEQRRDWDGVEDLSAVLYTGWDDTYFYFALDVSDDVLHPYDRDAEDWKGDCLVIGLDPTGDGGYHQHGNDQLMTLALTIPKRDKPGKDRKDGKGEDAEKEDDEDKPDGLFSVKKKEDDSGAIYEIALPWTSFSSEFESAAGPPAGYAFGLSLLLTDDDTGQGATKTLSMNPCHLLPRSQKNHWVWRFIVPYFFPRVVILE